MTDEWQAKVEQFMQDSVTHRRAMTLQMGAMEKVVTELQGSAQEAKEWNQKHQETLSELSNGIQALLAAGTVVKKGYTWSVPIVKAVAGLSIAGAALWSWLSGKLAAIAAIMVK